jgi:hypothetical protein
MKTGFLIGIALGSVSVAMAMRHPIVKKAMKKAFDR